MNSWGFAFTYRYSSYWARGTLLLFSEFKLLQTICAFQSHRHVAKRFRLLKRETIYNCI